MFAIQNIKTGKFLYGTDYRYRPPHQRTSNTKMLTYSSIAEAAHDFWVKRKCGKDYRIVVLKSLEVKRVIDYYETKIGNKSSQTHAEIMVGYKRFCRSLRYELTVNGAIFAE